MGWQHLNRVCSVEDVECNISCCNRMNLVFNLYAFFPEEASFPLGVCICKRETDGQDENG